MPGNLRFDMRFGQAASRRRAERGGVATRILLLADFTGRGAGPAPAVAERVPTRVDVDTFDAVLHRWAPRALIPAGGDSEPPTLLEFREFDAFHPDALVERLPTIAALRALRERLLDPATSAATVAQLQREAVARSDAGDPPSPPESDPATFERLLGRGSAPAVAGATTAVDTLVRRLVAPHIPPAVDPQAPHCVTAVDAALTAHLRRLLHAPAFQALESVWRAARWVVTNLETSEDLQLYLLDVTKDELATALASPAGVIEDSAAYRLLTRSHDDDAGWSILASGFRFGPSPEDIALLDALGTLGASLGAPFLGEADSSLLGCSSMAQVADPRQWSPLDPTAARAWSALRRSAAAAWLGLALPRVLLRLPYGRLTDPIEQFAFEEMPTPPLHDAYLWGSPAFACALLLGQAHAEAGPSMPPGEHQTLPDLPSHTWADGGATMVTPSSEVTLSERAVEAILGRGLIPLVSIVRENLVRVVRLQPLGEA